MGNDNQQDNNNQNNQGKNKGGGGGGGGQGLNLVAKFDAAAPGGVDNMKKQILGHASNSFGFIIGAMVAGIVFSIASETLGIKTDAPAQQGNNAPPKPGAAIWSLKELKKSDPEQFKQLAADPKNAEIFSGK